jgi:ribosomal protein L21E
VSAQPEVGAEVRVVATTLANGAPHPMLGRTGVVLEVRDFGPYPVRVAIGGRPVMFAAAELAAAVSGEITRDFP